MNQSDAMVNIDLCTIQLNKKNHEKFNGIRNYFAKSEINGN